MQLADIIFNAIRDYAPEWNRTDTSEFVGICSKPMISEGMDAVRTVVLRHINSYKEAQHVRRQIDLERAFTYQSSYQSPNHVGRWDF